MTTFPLLTAENLDDFLLTFEHKHKGERLGQAICNHFNYDDVYCPWIYESKDNDRVIAHFRSYLRDIQA